MGCVMMKMLMALFSMLWICFFWGVDPGWAEEEIAPKHEISTSEPAIAKSPPKNLEEKTDAVTQGRDPMSVPDDIAEQKGEVKPPEVRITGIIVTDEKTAAIAELNLENYKGEVMLEPGMTVSMPKPERDESMSNRWMTFFKVKRHNSLWCSDHPWKR